MRRTLLILGLALVIGVVGLSSCSRTILFPGQFSAAWAPTDIGLERVGTRLIETADGETIELWVFQGAETDAPQAVLYFHGNGGMTRQVARRLDDMRNRSGRAVYAPVYRGYGGSSGKPSEKGLMEDARAALAVYRAETGLEEPFLYGLSMGTGVASRLAEEQEIAALVLEAPFSSLPDAAKAQVPFLPARLIVRDKFRTAGRIARIDAPLLILHGDRDGVVKYRLGRKVFANAVEPKRFVTLKGGGHHDLWERGGAAVVLDWLAAVEAGEAPVGDLEIEAAPTR
ncbi:MAG: alpha/beta fold hydrolase [Pseudomonadota bacterium]